LPHLPPPLLLFTDTPPTQLYTLSLHDALPICRLHARERARLRRRRARPRPRDRRLRLAPVVLLQRPQRLSRRGGEVPRRPPAVGDRKSTRLNSSHVAISYAVFCLKKKNYTEFP